MMPADSSRTTPAQPVFSPIRLIPERIEKSFRRLNRTLFHTLRIASSNNPMRHVPKASQTRFIPCTWGVRRDDYWWDGAGSRQDASAFRLAAAGMAATLLSHPIAAWADLLPGDVLDVMATRSKLYLADYWVLTLHHLVWSKRLPHPINAQWVQGCSVHDEAFYFVSELPVDLAEASQDALILFQETAMEALVEREALLEDSTGVRHASLPSEPPLYHNGRWRLMEQLTVELDGQDQPAATVDMDHAPDEAEHDGPEGEGDDAQSDSSSLDLDDQSFTVHFGGNSYRFAGRNKQLFALLERISRRPGFRISFDCLRAVGDVWDGSPVEDSTIRGAVARLRKALKGHGLIDLANRITTGTYQGSGYVMLKAGATEGL